MKHWFNLLALQHSGSKRTEEVYIRSLREFLDLHNINDPELLIDQYNAVKYDLKKRQKITEEFVDKIELYAGHLRNRDLAKTTIARKTTAIKSFFNYNKVELDWEPMHASQRGSKLSKLKEELDELRKRIRDTDEHELKIIKMFDELLKDDPQLLEKFREKIRETEDKHTHVKRKPIIKSLSFVCCVGDVLVKMACMHAR